LDGKNFNLIFEVMIKSIESADYRPTLRDYISHYGNGIKDTGNRLKSRFRASPEFDTGLMTALHDMIQNHVEPYLSKPNPDTLFVGDGQSPAAVIATWNCLCPSHLTVLEPDTAISPTYQQLLRYVNQTSSDKRRRDYRARVSIQRRPIQRHTKTHKLVMAFGLHPQLQTEDDLQALINTSHDLVVLTTPDPTDVFANSLSSLDGTQIIAAAELDYGTLDRQIWILKNSPIA
jgi:hypothetical protein